MGDGTIWPCHSGGRYYSTDGFDLDKTTPHTNGQEQIRRLNLDGKGRLALSKRWSVTGSARFMREERGLD